MSSLLLCLMQSLNLLFQTCTACFVSCLSFFFSTVHYYYLKKRRLSRRFFSSSHWPGLGLTVLLYLSLSLAVVSSGFPFPPNFDLSVVSFWFQFWLFIIILLYCTFRVCILKCLEDGTEYPRLYPSMVKCVAVKNTQKVRI